MHVHKYCEGVGLQRSGMLKQWKKTTSLPPYILMVQPPPLPGS